MRNSPCLDLTRVSTGTGAPEITMDCRVKPDNETKGDNSIPLDDIFFF